MKKTTFVLLACLIVGFVFVSCDGEKTPPVPIEEKYAGKIYNATAGLVYDDLQTAMEEGKGTDCTIYVFKDISDLDQGFYINNRVSKVNYTMTIDLAGHTIDGSDIVVSKADFYYGTFDLRGGNFTVKNGTIIGCTDNKSTGVVRASNAESVTLENVNIYGTSDDVYNYAMLVNKTPVVINNTADNTIEGVIKVTQESTSDAPASVTINGGNFSKYAENTTIDYVLETYSATCPKAFVIKGGTLDGYVKVNSAVDQKQLDVDTSKYNVSSVTSELFSITAK